MARSLWGNLLELMAATGMQGAMKLGTEALTLPMHEEAQSRLMSKKALIESYTPILTTGTEPEREATATFLEGVSGSKLPRAPLTNPAGTEITSSTGAKLTAPTGMDLSTLAAGEKPVMGLVRPPARNFESLATGLLNRGITGTPGDIGTGATLLNTLKPAKRQGDLEYFMGLPPEQKGEAIRLMIAKGHPEIATYLSGPEGAKAIAAYNATKRGVSPTDLLIQAATNPELAPKIGAAATAMQPTPPNVAVINPDQPLPTMAPKGSIVTPSKTAKEPSLVEQEQKLLGTVTNTLGKINFNVPGETRDTMKQMIGQTIGQLNDLRARQNKSPITTSDLINNEYNKAMQVLNASRKTLGEVEYTNKIKMLNERKNQMLIGIGVQ